jgi:hypothetical protein
MAAKARAPDERIRNDRHSPGLRKARILRVSAARRTRRGHDSITGLELRHVFPRPLHLASQLGPENSCLPRFSDSEHEFRDRQHGFGHEREIANVAIPGRYGGRMDDEDRLVRIEYAESLSKAPPSGVHVMERQKSILRRCTTGKSPFDLTVFSELRDFRAREALKKRVIESCGTCAEHGCRYCSCQRHR